MEQQNKIVKLAKQIKKEHLFRITLWIAGISLTLIWLAFLIASSISTGEHRIYGEAITIENEAHFKQLVDSGYTPFLENQKIVMRLLKETKDLNPLCLTYDSSLTGWYLLVVLAPVGYMGCIYIIAVVKNMITPQAIKKTVRKALQFNYLKQKDVDYIVDEIDYNIGIKQRPEVNNEKQEPEPKEKELN